MQVPPPPTLEEIKRYIVTDTDWALRTVAQYGVAILPGVLDADDCATMRAKMDAFFENATADMPVPFRRDDSSTWPTLLDLQPSHGMLMQHWGIGHADFAWWLRQHPKIAGAFEKMYRTKAEDLLVSFDGASYQAPPDRADNPSPKRGWGSPEPWWHVDQSLRRTDYECMQAWVTGEAVEEGDATLAVMLYSHRQHAQIAHDFPALVDGKDWVRYGPEQVDALREAGCMELRIACPPGSIVLWDSRTAHYGAPPLPGRASPKWRYVVYLCYSHRGRSTAAGLKRKREVFLEGRTTAHWPHKIRVFGKAPRTYGKEIPPVRLPPTPRLEDLTPLGRRLAGFDVKGEELRLDQVKEFVSAPSPPTPEDTDSTAQLSDDASEASIEDLSDENSEPSHFWDSGSEYDSTGSEASESSVSSSSE